MKRRRLSLTALAGVLGVVGLTVLVSLSMDSEVVAISHPVMPGAGWPAARAPMPLPGTRAADPADPQELSVPVAGPAAGPVPVEAESGSDDPGRVADLVRRLQEIEARRPLDFHHGAAAELQPFLSMQQDDEQRLAGLGEAVRILDEWTPSPRVRGAVLALAGAWGGQAEVLARSAGPRREESWRSAMIGLLCSDSRSGDPAAGSIELSEYLDKVPRDGVVLLPLTLGRVPDATVHALLFDVASRVVDDLEQWHSRNLAVLALGTSVDERPDTLDLMTRLLFDPSAWGQQVRLPVCFVMAHARSDAAREVILEFLEDPQTGEGGKPLVRWWMADRSTMPGELEVLTAPLRDPAASTYAKYGAVGSLLKRGSAASLEEAAIMVGMLVDALDHETDQVLRLAMVSTLAAIPGEAARLRALEEALRTSPKAVTRLWAARGLGTVPPALTTRARAVLLSARSGETKNSVLAAIEEALLALE